MTNLPTTEYSEKFDRLRQNRMAVSYFKYGPIEVNYGQRLVMALPTLKKRIQLYEETGNTEWLVDAANMCMIECMFPQHPNAHFRATDSNESPGLCGTPVKELE